MTQTTARRDPRRASLQSTLASRLDEGLDGLGFPIERTKRAALLGYLELLAKWNSVYNLTSVRDPLDMLSVHLLDALSVVPLIDRLEPTEVLDVGSGAGLPGIPLAIVRPDMRVHSIDAVAKKIGFQWQVKTMWKLPNFFPAHGRVEALALAVPPDVIVSRAYADLAAMLASIDHVAAASTRVVAMKGARPAAEIAAVVAPWRVDEVVALDVPFLGAQRCAVVLSRVS